MQTWIHNSFFHIHKQDSFNMSKVPSCEKDNLKYFINILKAYGLNQQRLSKIERIEICRSKTQVVLVDQQEQGGHFRVAK